MTFLIFAAAALQIIGTAFTGIFSIKGLSIDSQSSVSIGGKPATTVTVNIKYLWMAKLGIIMLLFGIFLSSLASMMQV